MGARHATTQDNYLSRRHTWHSPKQHAAPALRPLQVMRSCLRG
ncbi:MAG: hypothetical protein K0S06_4080 [Microvirga sp.]|jgi:hypothetical protein|nr:hypothetical protein [Microvirga sp.]